MKSNWNGRQNTEKTERGRKERKGGRRDTKWCKGEEKRKKEGEEVGIRRRGTNTKVNHVLGRRERPTTCCLPPHKTLY